MTSYDRLPDQNIESQDLKDAETIDYNLLADKIRAAAVANSSLTAEVSSDTDEQVDYAEERRLDAMMDGSGFSSGLASATRTGVRPSQQPKKVTHKTKRGPKREPRHGDTESDLGAPLYYEPYAAPTQAEIEERERVQQGDGIRAARAAGALAAHNVIRKQTEGLPETYRLAAERAEQERRGRGRAS